MQQKGEKMVTHETILKFSKVAIFYLLSVLLLHPTAHPIFTHHTILPFCYQTPTLGIFPPPRSGQGSGNGSVPLKTHHWAVGGMDHISSDRKWGCYTAK